MIFSYGEDRRLSTKRTTFEVGAVDYIHKPFSGPIVLARVKTQLACKTRLAQAREAQNQADDLLHALLPKKAADEIRSIGTVIPRRYEECRRAVLRRDQFHGAIATSTSLKMWFRDLDALFVIFERGHRKTWAGKDQDYRRWLHGGRRASQPGRRSDRVGCALRPGNGIDADRRPSRLEVRVGVHPARWWQAWWGKGAITPTFGATPSTWRRACRTNQSRIRRGDLRTSGAGLVELRGGGPGRHGGQGQGDDRGLRHPPAEDMKGCVAALAAVLAALLACPRQALASLTVPIRLGIKQVEFAGHPLRTSDALHGGVLSCRGQRRRRRHPLSCSFFTNLTPYKDAEVAFDGEKRLLIMLSHGAAATASLTHGLQCKPRSAAVSSHAPYHWRANTYDPTIAYLANRLWQLRSIRPASGIDFLPNDPELGAN